MTKHNSSSEHKNSFLSNRICLLLSGENHRLHKERITLTLNINIDIVSELFQLCLPWLSMNCVDWERIAGWLRPQSFGKVSVWQGCDSDWQEEMDGNIPVWPHYNYRQQYFQAQSLNKQTNFPTHQIWELCRLQNHYF